jgi:hypothetical protein
VSKQVESGASGCRRHLAVGWPRVPAQGLRYPIFRRVRCAARRKLEDIFDDLATQTGLAAVRLAEGSLLLDGPGVFIEADGWRKAGYCSCQMS